MGTELSPNQRGYLQTVSVSSDALLALINDILHMSKIEAGKLELEETDFILWDAVDGVTKLMAIRAHEKGLELACRVAPDVPDWLIGDPARLRRILVNLVGNAIKFTEAGEMVSVEVVSLDDVDVLLRFSVKDTGIGISADKQALLFEAFSQADTSTTREFGGTGLGLNISLQLVHMMDGKLEVDSEKGVGSTFHFVARFAASTAPEPAISAAALASLQGLPVLVVDDNETNRSVLLEMLNNWGMANGRAALNALRIGAEDGTPFPLVLVDGTITTVDSTDVGSLELVRQINATPELLGSKVMMLSSLDDQDYVARVQAQGVRSYLPKPVTQSDLLDAIVTALAGQVTVGSAAATNAEDDRPPLRILLAEDNIINQQVAVGLLQIRGHSVTIANNGLEALEALNGEMMAPDVILMDVQMPGMGGFETTAKIRELEQGTDVHQPIIGLTAMPWRVIASCVWTRAWMDGYVAKPVRQATLFEAIDMVLAINR